MATSKKRTAQQEQQQHGFPAWTTNPLVVALIVVALGFLGWTWIFFNSRLTTLEGKMNKVEQDLADGGSHALVALLQKSQSPQQAAASMNLARAQVQVNVAKGQVSNPKFVDTLAPAIAQTAVKFPDLPDTWQAVSTVANYRTAALTIAKNSAPLPDCGAEHAQKKQIYQRDYPQFNIGPAVDAIGYLFENCTLHLSHLPPGQIYAITMPPNLATPEMPAGRYLMGYPAFALNCVIVLDDEGISKTEISYLEVRNCRFQFDVNQVPAKREQRLLLAALRGNTPESEQLPVGNTTQGG